MPFMGSNVRNSSGQGLSLSNRLCKHAASLVNGEHGKHVVKSTSYLYLMTSFGR